MKRDEIHDEFLRGYLDAALFTEDPTPPGGVDYVESGRADEMFPKLPNEFIIQAAADCAVFQHMAETSLMLAGDAGRNGHDFWLSRNGHGAGFFDREYSSSEYLQSLAEKFGEHYLDL